MSNVVSETKRFVISSNDLFDDKGKLCATFISSLLRTSGVTLRRLFPGADSFQISAGLAHAATRVRASVSQTCSVHNDQVERVFPTVYLTCLGGLQTTSILRPIFGGKTNNENEESGSQIGIILTRDKNNGISQTANPVIQNGG